MRTETLNAGGKSSVEVHYHGAHITSWKNNAGREMIYTSPIAVYDGANAIRGGVPICFPQFGKKGPLRQHGFARNMPWKLDTSFKSESEHPSLRFQLESTQETMGSDWPFRFRVDYTVTLSSDGNKLTIDMDVTNTDDRQFLFTTALHSYFTCDPENTVLPDLNGTQYIDSIDPSADGLKLQQGDITFGEEVDRIYIDSPSELTIPSVGLTIGKTNFPEAVVWNPYVDKSRAMSDLPDDGWKQFICIEPACIEEPALVNPSQTWSCQCILISRS